VSSLERKASLNANVAHLSFLHRPEIEYIVHAHIELPGAIRADRETTPGTQEDWESVQELIRSDERLIYQPHHGIILLLDDLSELEPILEQNNIYHRRADLYDLAYSRFQKSERFLDIICDSLTTDSRVLDLAAGTGEVSSLLLRRGFTDLILADASAEMLRVARGKLPSVPTGHFVCVAMEDVDDHEAYDGIVIRQAINYLTPKALGPALMRWRAALNPGGKLLFNSFLYDAERTPISRSFRDEVGEHVVVTQEGVDVAGNIVHHGQRTEIFHKAGGYQLVYDLNRFFVYSEAHFVEACAGAGFSQVRSFHERNSLYLICER
jgi:SAM-dependent methyltransferase